LHTLNVGIRAAHEDTQMNLMQAYGRDGLLSQAEMEDLTEYLLSFSGRQHDSASTSRGKALFAAQCASCHGDDARGDQSQGAHGLYRNIKWLALFVLLGIYYITPWIRWDRGPGQPSQAVLVDFENARFYFFFIEIWPQEVYYITGLLILAALGLFLATSLFGRVWCGYACPQTIWTDLFIQVEKFFEGDRNARMKLDKAPWTTKKVFKKTGKHLVWLLIAALTGGAWILYFHDAPTIARDFFTGHAPTTSYVFITLMTFTTYWLAGHMREQVCTYMCPWPRIQAAMIDEDALNVTYRYDRGEPRGAHKKGTSWDDRGDCIDCRQCVAVCPVGIDIRDGLQLECIV